MCEVKPRYFPCLNAHSKPNRIHCLGCMPLVSDVIVLRFPQSAQSPLGLLMLHHCNVTLRWDWQTTTSAQIASSLKREVP